MAVTLTTNYNLIKPNPFEEVDAWGPELNTNFDTIDSTMKSISNVANAAMPKAGGAFTGAITISTPLVIGSGGTGANTAAAARTALGLQIGLNVQAWSNSLDDMAAIGGVGPNGFFTRINVDNIQSRTLTGTANEITVTNGAGLAGDPLFSLPNALTFTGKTVTGGILNPDGVAASGNITINSATGVMGYSSGAGGTVTQGTSNSTGVTIDKPCGQIVMFGGIGAGATDQFVVTNSRVTSADVVILSLTTNAPLVEVHAVQIGNGTFRIAARNTGGSASGVVTINFAIINGVTA